MKKEEEEERKRRRRRRRRGRRFLSCVRAPATTFIARCLYSQDSSKPIDLGAVNRVWLEEIVLHELDALLRQGEDHGILHILFYRVEGETSTRFSGVLYDVPNKKMHILLRKRSPLMPCL